MAIFSKKNDEPKETKEERPPAPGPRLSAAGNVSAKLLSVLRQPRISEKAGHLVNLGKYVFMVRRFSNKIDVKKAVESAYKVKVVAVNIINVKGKRRNYGRKSGLTSDFKKAVVTLKKGDKIEGLTDVV